MDLLAELPRLLPAAIAWAEQRARKAAEVGAPLTPAVKIRKQTRININRAQLEAEYPDVFDEVREEKEVVFIDLP